MSRRPDFVYAPALAAQTVARSESKPKASPKTKRSKPPKKSRRKKS